MSDKDQEEREPGRASDYARQLAERGEEFTISHAGRPQGTGPSQPDRGRGRRRAARKAGRR